jgi:hypothetical protein
MHEPQSWVDQGALDHFELNRTAHRRLDPELKLIDLALQRWAPWAPRPHYGQLGYPTRSITERVNEGGILARNTPPVAPEWPPAIAALDAQIARLPTRHMAAIMANYLHMALPLELRIQVYVTLSRFLARTRSTAQDLPVRKRTNGAGVAAGRGAFQHDLDRARWTLRHALSRNGD